ncbi:unnamed protein product [Hymenolepis diminuta]|uniref:Uncharacterized protein n=1 Tax=Hymenolepis diminuta TaxID=6216 RepID=A0A564YEE1_HYMDI|nr:unnamed protein product [Hymenolepis diminuta]
MFSRGLTQVIRIKPSLFSLSRPNARVSITNSYAPLSSPLFLSTLPTFTLINRHCGYLEYIFI